MESKILVIDDESAIRKSFELALEDSGHEVTTVESGEKGIEEIQSKAPASTTPATGQITRVNNAP